MARITGKTGAVKIGGVKVASLTGWAINVKLDTVNATAFEDVWHTLLATFLGWSGSVDGIWMSAGANIDFWTACPSGAVVTLDLYPDIGTTEKLSGTAFCDFSIKVAKDGVVTFTAAVNGTGALTRTP
jgi:hypothetical protein